MKETFETKIKSVENHLIEHGSITSWQAIQKYQATRLSGIIFVLRERGLKINSIREKDEKSHWVRYVLFYPVTNE